ncbi:MAG: protein kinase, partial [Candidatus Acidiferrum sp.]
MSPEQVRGEKLDARSDLFSFGVVLYEMATGHMAFSGSTSGVIFDAILNRSPVSPIRLQPELPARLEEILNKALEKNRDVRYQHASEIRADLQRLKRDRDSGKLATPTQAHESAAANHRKETNRRKALFLTRFTLAVLGLVTFGYAIHSYYRAKSGEAPFTNFTIAKLTDAGNLTAAAISPDGKYVVNVVENNGMQSLWLRNVATNSDAQIVAPAQTQYGPLQFSPDGDYIYFMRGNRMGGDLYIAPVLGGNPRLVVKDISSGISFSPDGHRMSFFTSPVRDQSNGFRNRLLTSNLEGGDEKELLKVDVGSQSTPAWSPDGKAIVIRCRDIKTTTSSLIAVEATSGKQQTIISSPEMRFEEPIWLPDGRSLVVLNSDRKARSEQWQIGLVSYPAGNFGPITHDTNSYSRISVSRDGKTLTAVQKEQSFKLYLMPSREKTVEHANAITPRGVAYSFAWMDEQNLLLGESGRFFRMSTHGETKTLLFDGSRYDSADGQSCQGGRYIVFSGIDTKSSSGDTTLWRVDTSNNEVMRLTEGPFDASPVCSPDGKWIYFVRTNGSTVRPLPVQKVSIDGGISETVGGPMDILPSLVISRDGRLLGFCTFKQALGVLNADNGRVAKEFSLDPHNGASSWELS